MASNSIKKAFTILESLVVLLLFMTAITLGSQIYFNLVKTNVQAQNLQLAFDNVRFGAEKIWGEVKAGSEFVPTSESLEFRTRRCQRVRILKSGNNLIFESAGQQVPIFDDSLVSLRNFRIYYDNPPSSGAYYQTANKVFIFDYDFELKGKNANVPFSFRQTVAPSNSVLINKPCR